MRLAQILFSQGFGTRRVCAGMVEQGLVRVAGLVVDDPAADFDTTGLEFEVDGRPWPYHEHALILLHKPAGFECSQKPRHHPSVLTLLPRLKDAEVAESVLHRQGSDGEQKAARRTFLERLMLRPL